MIILMKCLDEEFLVNRCIGDFHDENWISDIIVIDGGSNDFTRNELRRFSKVRVYVHPWLSWYHAMETCQSNIALSYVPNGKLAFIMDFDERMNDKLKDELAKIDEHGFDYDVGHVARRTVDVLRYEGSPYAMIEEDGWPMESHQIGQWPDYQCRLIRKQPKLHWVNSPHHVMLGIDAEKKLPDTAFVLHYEKDDMRHRQRIEKRWLANQEQRSKLGLTADMFEGQVKPEISEFLGGYFEG